MKCPPLASRTADGVFAESWRHCDLDFDPSSSREMKGPYFGLIQSINQQGRVMICSITQGVAAVASTYGTVGTLIGAETYTQGAVHCHQLKSLDCGGHGMCISR